ncbi:MAG: hypothetical protein Q8R90_02750 [Bacteroidales bacterium]|nr:hypothetical protein [Bacteroidales bacterium]MDZ4059254.1 DUF6599 family protein [Bacteroidales bacterium]
MSLAGFKKRYIALILSVISIYSGAVSVKAQSPEIVRERKFTGAALYGFINGGSDLYLEYGFLDLRVLDVKYNGESFTLEIYRMPTPEDAFGIYSLHTFRCDCADSMMLIDCHSPYQIQTVVGEHYISVVYENLQPGINRDGIELLLQFTQDMSKTPPAIPDTLIKRGKPLSGRVKYLRGNLALVNSAPELVTVMEGYSQFSLWVSEDVENATKRALLLSDSNEMVTIVKERVSATTLVYDNKEYLMFEF